MESRIVKELDAGMSEAQFYQWKDGIFRIYPEPVDIYDEIKAERVRQDEKCGEDRNLPPEYWSGYLLLKLYKVEDATANNTPPPNDYRTEMVQVASLAVEAIESYDRQQPPKQRKCPDCSGSGIDMPTKGDYFTGICSRCKGEGTITTEKEKEI